MKTWDLVLHFDNSDCIGHVAALARLLDGYPNDKEIYDDDEFWNEEVAPALEELHRMIHHYLECYAGSEKLTGAYSGTKNMRAAAQRMQFVSQFIVELCDEYDKQGENG